MMKLDTSKVLHKSFEIGLLMKAFDGILEIIGGILLLFLNPAKLDRITVLLTQRELVEDPKDLIANFVLKFSSQFTISTQYFGVLYLVSHGVIKIILMILLWKRKLWAYPLTIVSLILFVIYQLYRYTIHHSAGMIVLTIFDIIVIILTFIEYRRIKNNLIVLN